MIDEFHMKISIPTDDDGYILFKATPTDIEDNGLLGLFCPSCGLSNDNYITDEVLELALAMTRNKAQDIICDEFKKAERQFKKGIITFKAGKPPKHEPENQNRIGIEALEIASFPCCYHTAKIKPILKITGCYCPFCRAKNYEVE